MNIAIVGSTGTLGRVLARYLTAQGAQLSFLLRRPDPELASLGACQVSSQWVFDDAALNAAVHGAEVVINLAARNPAGQAKDLAEVDDFLLVNALAPAVVAAACTQAKVPLLHFSTVAVYEVANYRAGVELREDEGLPQQDQTSTGYYNTLMEVLRTTLTLAPENRVEAFREVTAHHPYPPQASVYGLTKLLGERLVLEVAERTCAIRLSDVFGPGHESRGVIVDHLRRLPDSRPEVDLDFRTTAAFIFIDDVVSATRDLARRLALEPDLPSVVNLTGHRLDTPGLAAVLTALATRRGLGVPNLDVVSRPPAETFDRRYDSSRLASVLPGFSQTPLDVALDRTWDALALDPHGK